MSSPESNQHVAAEDSVETLVAEGHLARVYGLAVGARGGELPPGRALRARRHVGRKIDPDGGAVGVGRHQSAEHLARSGGYFENLHAVADAGSLQGAAVGPRMKQHGGDGIDGRHPVVDAPCSFG